MIGTRGHSRFRNWVGKGKRKIGILFMGAGARSARVIGPVSHERGSATEERGKILVAMGGTRRGNRAELGHGLDDNGCQHRNMAGSI